MAVRNFFWLYQGIIAGSGRPGGEMSPRGLIPANKTQGEALDDDLLWLRDQGIGAILTLTETPLSSQTLERHGFTWRHLPIDDQTAPTEADFLAALDFIDQQRVAQRGVLIHCRIGEGRTACILAAYLLRQGATVEQALEHLRAFRPGAVSSSEQQRALAAFASDRAWII